MYERCSAELLEFLKDRCPVVEPFSIDECFMDMTGMERAYRRTFESRLQPEG
ncbi:MAG: hypothetical protein ACOX3Q_08410 [Clostridia bacterium]